MGSAMKRLGMPEMLSATKSIINRCELFDLAPWSIIFPGYAINFNSLTLNSRSLHVLSARDERGSKSYCHNRREM